MPDVRRAMRTASTRRCRCTAYKRCRRSSPIDPVAALVRLAVRVVRGRSVASLAGYMRRCFFVSQRTRELGLRVALGAEPSKVVGLIMRQAAFLAVSGGIVGVVLGIVAARALARALYGVSAAEPLVYVAAAAVLVVAASFASYGPARRASSIDPMIALRAE